MNEQVGVVIVDQSLGGVDVFEVIVVVGEEVYVVDYLVYGWFEVVDCKELFVWVLVLVVLIF